jgi:hypothetical protein
MALLSPRDREVIESQKPDPNARSTISVLSHGLLWSDEVTPDLSRMSPEGWRVWYDLLAARSMLHAGYPVGAIPKNVGDFERAWWNENVWKVWNAALAEGVKWIGFRRLKLSPEERAMFDKYRYTPPYQQNKEKPLDFSKS